MPCRALSRNKEHSPAFEIRPGFGVFDTDAQEAIMRFGGRTKAATLAIGLTISEALDQLKEWTSTGS